MRKLKERRKFLRKQIELLAKESENCFPELLPEYSREIVRLNRELVPFFRVVYGIILPYAYLGTVLAVLSLKAMRVAVRKLLVQTNYIPRSEEKKKNWW